MLPDKRGTYQGFPVAGTCDPQRSYPDEGEGWPFFLSSYHRNATDDCHLMISLQMPQQCIYIQRICYLLREISLPLILVLPNIDNSKIGISA